MQAHIEYLIGVLGVTRRAAARLGAANELNPAGWGSGWPSGRPRKHAQLSASDAVDRAVWTLAAADTHLPTQRS